MITMCPMCNGPGIVLGSLGRLTHFRCRNCGWDFTQERGSEESPSDGPSTQVEHDEGEEL